MSIVSLLSPSSNSRAVLAALSKSLALIEFDPSGRILTANENFLKAMGYKLSEIVGQHHGIFVDPAFAATADYREFWSKLGRGEFDAAEYKRIAKGGHEVWLQATYNPVLNARGKVIKVVKIATDTTQVKLKTVESIGKLDAISRAQAVIEFTTSGEVLTANENFLSALGYRLDEIRGKHHRMFIEPSYAQSSDYRKFWDRLRGGEFIAEEFMRLGKGGKEVWIQASYNPIFDPDGKVMKVVKFATDITGRVHAVKEIGAGLGRLAEGDLRREITEPFIPALDKLREDFNNSVTTLRGALQAVGQTASSIDGGAAEISKSADELSKRTEQQAASVEETAAALEQITITVATSAKRAEEAGILVGRTTDVAEKSETIVKQAIEAMGQIETSSRAISNIIGVIDEIAFQTNLLALNAGIEAARAGDAGRGFAVVAQEVRELAQRSANAAKEIKTLITKSSEQVASGVNLVGETGQALATIMSEVKEVNRNVVAIAEASREQSSGLQEINTAVTTMDQNTQQNAAMVEESSAASQSLANEVVQLNRLLSQFQFGPAVASRSSNSTVPASRPSPTARALTGKVSRAFSGNAALAHDH